LPCVIFFTSFKFSATWARTDAGCTMSVASLARVKPESEYLTLRASPSVLLLCTAVELLVLCSYMESPQNASGAMCYGAMVPRGSFYTQIVNTRYKAEYGKTAPMLTDTARTAFPAPMPTHCALHKRQHVHLTASVCTQGSSCEFKTKRADLGC